MIKNGKWSRKYDNCIICGTIEKKHQAKGMCKNCWDKKWQKDNPEKVNKKRRNWDKLNHEKSIKYHREYRKKHPEKIIGYRRKGFLKHNYNLSLSEYNNILQKQNNKCAICDTETAGGKSNGPKIFYVDHNHETGKIRGLLCHKCNTSLSGFKESEKILFRAIDYLRTTN